MQYFFLVGHVQYARYLTHYFQSESKADIVCRHHNRYWNAVSADQFGEQTAIKIGKGALKGMTLLPELVSEWINAFPITFHVTNRMDSIYSDIPDKSIQEKHKEELKHRRILDGHDQSLIDAEVESTSIH